jgi:hypothetical protein
MTAGNLGNGYWRSGRAFLYLSIALHPSKKSKRKREVKKGITIVEP